MIYRCIFNIFLFTKMLGLLRGASYIAPGANAVLLFVARGCPAASLRLASHLGHHTLHPIQ